MAYDRYSLFRKNGQIEQVPSCKIPKKGTDFFELYRRGETRLDIISYNYYGDARYAWLIMMANPEYGSLEYAIPDGVTLRIPYPLAQTLSDYESAVESYNTLYKY